jgi:hypothetical protein
MVDLALERLRQTDTRHIDELNILRAKSVKALGKQARLASQKSMYHFGKLPIEICSAIFLLAMENHKSRVVTFSHVCRHWRDVALGAPELWRSLTMTRKTTKRQVEAWIQRSRGMLFELATKEDFLFGWRLDLVPLFSGIIWERLETLSLELTTGAKDLHDLLPADIFPRLRPLDISFTDSSTPPKQVSDKFWSSLDAIDVSRLRSLSFTHISNIPWNTFSRITTLRALSISSDALPLPDTLQLLHNNPNLEHLTLSCVSRFQPSSTVPSPSEAPPSLPKLTHMSLRLANAVQYLHMCRIIAPNLTHLYIDSALQSVSYLDALLKSGLGETALTNLSELTFRQCVLDDRLLVEVLRRAQRLEKLGLQGSLLEDINNVVDALSKCPPSPMDLTEEENLLCPRRAQQDKLLCPYLQHVDFSQQPKLQPSPIIRLVQAHEPEPDSPIPSTASSDTATKEDTNDSNAIIPIRSIIVDTCPNITPDALPWLRSKVEKVSCVYLTKKQVNATKARRLW